MRVSYEWLSTMVDLPDDPQDLVAEFVRTGTEVESVDRLGVDFDHIVTGRVLAKEAHPNSDHLWVCRVDVGAQNVGEDGEPEPLQIVCGAQNFEAGDHVVVSMVGATLPDGTTIKKSKLRGVESCGMNCSERELGLGSDHAGIMILPEDAPVGVPFAQWYGIADTVLDCEITPNRPDCLSMLGMATEVGAILDEDVRVELPRVEREQGPDAHDLVEVEIDDPGICQRYCARVVRNVKVGPSPEWLARRVTAAGARPISNVVDVTNYVMFLTGQPLHAFDLGKLSERDGRRHVVVRAARDGERVVTLDGQERVCTPDVGLITDDRDRPVALAGVMGGQNSEIDETTCDVLLESARFDAGHTSRTSRSLDLMSEASIRFERGVDTTRCRDVADIAAALFEECCGAEVCPGVVDVYPEQPEAPVIALRADRVRALAGAPIADAEMERFLARLGCGLSAREGGWDVVPPTNRPDLVREVDLIEEVVRLWGMDRVEATLPAARNHAGGLTVDQQRVRRISEVLRACGLNEAQTYNFARPGDLDLVGMSERGRGVPVEIINPLFAEQSQMRRSILPGLLRSVAYNQAHGTRDIALYEIGRVFFGHAHASQPDEPSYVSAVMAGGRGDAGWDVPEREVDFFDAKFVVEELLRSLRVEKVRFRPTDPEEYGWLQPGRAAEVYSGARLLGWVGNVHPAALARLDVEGDVVAFELAEEPLLRLAQRELPYREVPTLPGSEVDLAIIVDEDVTCETLVQRITSAGGRLLDSVRLFDVYRDEERVGSGRKSMAFSLTYRAADRTLTSEEVERAHAKVVRKVCQATGGEVRGA